jgi:predicted Zn-dependent protease
VVVQTPKIFTIILLLAASSWVSAAAITGEDIYKEVLSATPVYTDPELTAYIEKLGREIVSVSEMAGREFTFTLLDSPDLNAFATRGNYVYINRGLLNYVSNEAQLVSVMAHEVAHITRNHVTGAEGKATGAQILATLAAVFSGSNEVYEAGMAYANSLIRGHGRANELEADEAGAEYMARLGFDPREMLEMLSVMKDMESLQKKRAKEQGAPRQTYHGLFASHPRNDARLRSVVTQASSARPASTRDNGATRYRQLTDGLIWGENFAAKEKKTTRYSNMNLRVRFDFPEDWSQELDANGIGVSGSEHFATARWQGNPTRPPEGIYRYPARCRWKTGCADRGGLLQAQCLHIHR